MRYDGSIAWRLSTLDTTVEVVCHKLVADTFWKTVKPCFEQDKFDMMSESTHCQRRRYRCFYPVRCRTDVFFSDMRLGYKDASNRHRKVLQYIRIWR